jgi:hypothetical protein
MPPLPGNLSLRVEVFRQINAGLHGGSRVGICSNSSNGSQACIVLNNPSPFTVLNAPSNRFAVNQGWRAIPLLSSGPLAIVFLHKIVQAAHSLDNQLDVLELSDYRPPEYSPTGSHYAKHVFNDSTCSTQPVVKNALVICEPPLWVRPHQVLCHGKGCVAYNQVRSCSVS